MNFKQFLSETFGSDQDSDEKGPKEEAARSLVRVLVYFLASVAVLTWFYHEDYLLAAHWFSWQRAIAITADISTMLSFLFLWRVSEDFLETEEKRTRKLLEMTF